jgi:WD40 repeat protein
MFAVGTWDGSLRIFNVEQNQQGNVGVVQKFSMKLQAPIMGLAWNGQNNGLFLGCADNFVRAVDLSASKSVDIGKHTSPVKDVFFVAAQNTIISTSYDKNINFWQVGNPNPVFNLPIANKIYVSDFVNPIFGAGLADEKILLFDINNIGRKVILDSQLGKGSQIQSLAISPDCETFGVGSIDGRANLSALGKQTSGDIKLVQLSIIQSNVMTFKSNKIDETGKCILYPVNSVGFNARSKNWFFTAGGDGYMQLWDYQARNKIKQIGFARTPITCAKVSPSGDMVAYALGNDWHMGSEGIGMWKNKLAVHYIKDDELKFLK